MAFRLPLTAPLAVLPGDCVGLTVADLWDKVYWMIWSNDGAATFAVTAFATEAEDAETFAAAAELDGAEIVGAADRLVAGEVADADPAGTADARVPPLFRAADRVFGEPTAEVAPVAESPPTDEESDGVAHATPTPPTMIEAPIPRATAKPPTRPTQADARIPKPSPPMAGGQNVLVINAQKRGQIGLPDAAAKLPNQT